MKEFFRGVVRSSGSVDNPSLAVTVPKIFVNEGLVVEGSEYFFMVSDKDVRAEENLVEQYGAEIGLLKSNANALEVAVRELGVEVSRLSDFVKKRFGVRKLD